MKRNFIEVNFNGLKPYEWDNYLIIDNIKLKRVSTKTIKDIMSYESIIGTNEKYMLLSDGHNSIVIKLGERGKVVKRSFLTFDRELDIDEYASMKKIQKINYKITDKKIKYDRELYEEKNIKKYLVNIIKTSKDEDKIKYLYYLYFDEIKNYSKEKLIKFINSNESNKYYKLYEFLISN